MTCTGLVNALLVVALFVQAAVAPSARGQSEKEALDVIAQVFADNRQRFDSFSCRFQVVRGRAESVEDAWKEKLAVRSVEDGLLVARKGDLRYDMKCLVGELSLAELKKQITPGPGTRHTPTDCLSRAEMFSKGLGMRVTRSSTLESVNFVPNMPIRAMHTPLSMGIMGPGDRLSPLASIQTAQSGKSYCKYLGTEVLGGNQVDVIECGTQATNDPQQKSIWYLDLAHGAVPRMRRSIDADGSLVGETRVLEIKKVESGGFICAKCVTVYPDSDAEACTVWIITLTSIDMTDPTAEMLGIDLPAGTRVMNTADPRSTFRLSRPEKLRLDDLPEWLKRCDEKLAIRIQDQKRLGVSFESPTHHPGRWIWWSVMAGGAAMAVVGIFYCLRRFSAA